MNSTTSPRGDSLIAVRDARVRINRRRVLVVDQFEIAPGEHWCLAGGNGAGKSVMARLLRGELVSGRQHVSYGQGFEPAHCIETVSFEEQQRLWSLDNRRDISEYDAEVKDPGTTVAQLICGQQAADLLQREHSRMLLDRLEIGNLLERGIRFLSSGQIRKALLARALLSGAAGEHRLLILDEPLEAIDRQAAPVVQELLGAWMDRSNATLLLCRREADLLPGITHLAMLENLHLVAQGPRAEVESTEAFRRFALPRVPIPESLPAPKPETRVTSPRQAPIRLQQVSASFGDRLVLNQVSWLMDVDDHTLIEGPNGCGKSTLLSLIDGENHKAYGQQVELFGVKRGSGESVWDIKSHFGIVSNEIHNRYVKGWKVIDVVISGFFDSVGLYDDSGASQEETAIAWLEALGLAGLARDTYHEISFGQQRMVLLARAMVKQPDVLVLDEPCVGLDDYFRGLVLGTIDRIAEQTPTQIIYVSHTEGEEPRCITQRLRFEPASGGGYRLLEF